MTPAHPGTGALHRPRVDRRAEPGHSHLGWRRRLVAVSGRLTDRAAEADRRLDAEVRLRTTWLAGLALVTAVAYGRRLSSVSFWRDEVASVEIARRPLPALLHTLGTVDAVHGLYYVVLHFWLSLGSGEAFTRVPSTIFAVTAVVVVAELARRRIGVVAATAVAALLAGNTFFGYFAQEARGYTLAACLVAVTAFGLLGRREPLSAGRLVVIGVSASAAVYANLFAILGLTGLVLGHLLWTRTLPTRGLLVTGSAVAASLVPLVLLASRQAGNQTWIARPQLKDPALVVRYYAGSYLLVAGLGLVLVGVAYRLVRDRRLGRPGARGTADALALGVPLLCAVVLEPAVLLAYSTIGTPVYVGRYLVAVVPLAAVAVLAVVRLSRHAALLSLVILALGLVSALGPVDQRDEDLRAAATYLEANGAPADCVVYEPGWARSGLEFYLAQGGRAPVDVAEVAGGRSADAATNLYGEQGAEPGVQSALRGCPRVWIAGYPGNQSSLGVPDVGMTAFRVLEGGFVAAPSAARNFGSFHVELWTTTK